ncbi:uncharacterized protein LOC142024930 isoform X2 [Carettochelys insculpta]|uniref:uncharacterized protein LOC142024930 isoform X2 n=1 Tax=Carettochelys insculpta TaxID=44489 RepID=UPI003EC00904
MTSRCCRPARSRRQVLGEPGRGETPRSGPGPGEPERHRGARRRVQRWAPLLPAGRGARRLPPPASLISAPPPPLPGSCVSGSPARLVRVHAARSGLLQPQLGWCGVKLKTIHVPKGRELSGRRAPMSGSRAALALQRQSEDMAVAAEPVTLKEVSVCFSQEEWGLLAPGQRALYREVMQENYQTVRWLGSLLSPVDSFLAPVQFFLTATCSFVEVEGWLPDTEQDGCE